MTATPLPSQPCPPPGRGRPKDNEKCQAILDAAQKIFSEKGFAKSSMDAIAQAANVSKLTLYSHFKDKEGLFIATVEQRCFAQIPFELLEKDYQGLSPPEALFKLGRAALDAYLKPQSIATYRLLISEAASQPHLMKTYFDTAVGGMVRRICVILDLITSQGGYHFPHLRRAAMHFYALLKDGLHTRFVFNVLPLPTREEQDAHLREVIELFLRAHKI